MTDYTLIHIDLDDPNSYAPTTAVVPGIGDRVFGVGVSGRDGSLAVDHVENLVVTNNASVSAGSAKDITVGNTNGAGGDVTFTIGGTVTGFVTVYKNGGLTAQTVTGTIQLHGGTTGTIDLTESLAVGGTDNSVDVVLDGGAMTVDNALDFTGAQSDVSVDNGATLDVATMSFAGGRSTLSITDGGQVNVSGIATLAAGDDDSVSLDNGGGFTAATAAVTVGGSAFDHHASFFVDNQSEADIASLAVTGEGIVRSLGGVLTVVGDIDIGVDEDGGRVEVSDFSGPLGTLKADNVSVGNGMGSVDHCGEWTYADDGTSGTLAVGEKGYASIAGSLTLDNKDDSGIGLSDTASLEVGGDNGYVAGQFLVDGLGLVIGHGTLAAPSFVVDGGGVIEASDGTLVLDGDVSGDGTLEVDDSTTLRLTGSCSTTVKFLARADTSLAHSSILGLDDPADFTGSIEGLTSGCTVVLSGQALAGWTGLASPILSHTDIDGSQLVLTFTDNQDGNALVTRSLDIAGDLDGHVFTTRKLAGSIALSFTDASDQIRTDVDGTPTGGGNPFVDSLVNGWAGWDPSKGPISYFFGTTANIESAIDVHGSTRFLSCDDTVDGWSQPEMDAFARALGAYSAATGLTFEKADTVEEANLVFWQKPVLPGVAAASDFPSAAANGHLWLIFDPASWTTQRLRPGGDSQFTIVHELGHAMGLAHPQDGGLEPDRTRFPGVGFNAAASTGTDGQNQAIFTVMSDVRGWKGEPPTREYGGAAGIGAFDIAALQELYGTNDHATGNGRYTLPKLNQAGTGWACIWDTGGNDMITAQGIAKASTIDLRAAPLSGPNAGGYISHVGGIRGGFTIAHDVTIENATGGSAADRLVGNPSDNVLNGGLGKDILGGGAGRDTFIFNTAIGPANLDRIVDFSVADDTIKLENAVFTGIGGNGVLAAVRFHVGPHAHNANDRIIYNPGTGALLYDANGTGAGHETQFASLARHLAVTHADFIVS